MFAPGLDIINYGKKGFVNQRLVIEVQDFLETMFASPPTEGLRMRELGSQ